MEVFDSNEWIAENRGRLILGPPRDVEVKTFIKQLKGFIKLTVKNAARQKIAENVIVTGTTLYMTDSWKMFAAELRTVNSETSYSVNACWNAKEILKALEKAEEMGVGKDGAFITKAGDEIRVVGANKEYSGIDIKTMKGTQVDDRADLDVRVNIRVFDDSKKWAAIDAVKDEGMSVLEVIDRKLYLTTNIEEDQITILLDEDVREKCKVGINRHWLRAIFRTLEENIKLQVGNPYGAVVILAPGWWCLLMPMGYK